MQRATNVSVVLLVAAAMVAVAAAGTPWMDLSATPESRAKALLKEMTLDEKITMLHGSTGPYVGNVPANTRLGIPALNLNDGPQGFRDNAHPGTTTCWPSGLTVAATWDLNAMKDWGTAMGKEFYDKGANIQLGPGLCVARVPVNGRNFEYLSGEDPFLGYTLVQPVIQGIQSQGVLANAKHYVQNNQETNRSGVSENVDERTQFEIYYPPFQGALDADVGSFMCSYNKINNVYSCENNQTLNVDLKDRLGSGKRFFVMSDWGATHSTSINEGLDQEMPGGTYMSTKLKTAVQTGAVSQDTLDNSVLNVLTPLFAVGVFDSNNTNSISNNVTSDAHNKLARQLSAKSHVLLKNDGNALPLNKTIKNVGIFGAQGASSVTVHGGGSGSVVPPYVVTPMEGILAKMGLPPPPQPSKLPCDQCVYFADGTNQTEVVDIASKVDVALVFVSTTSSEGSDRPNLSLGNGQDELIDIVAARAAKTVVVATVPGAILTPWRNDVDAILVNFMPGQELGNAVADVLFGDENPAARLPLTFPNIDNEVGFTERQYPGLDNAAQAYYDEKLLVGYRWYDARGVTPAFPFGHGLSYTTFKYANLRSTGNAVSVDISNTGSRDGEEVVQLYLGFPSSAGEPPKQLKGFSRVLVSQGGARTVTFNLTDRDFSIWDTSSHAWKKVKGIFNVYVGASSRDIRLSGTLTVA
ncbi:hypothetical protein PTSG_00514 [Salpingoeca rosetta]|uniref:Probable beta-glucosidase G n=1 Tax=Salpingoeca rosetta (strain ATCC 50818 / BSB-021) TaxID=946362 RepID=F2TWP2_SALR5|nr:uncharacterized protein PTSG_00514 [Salpingoeca rosetta]EGD72488.1 hypothetical protein PTSG_00514 [Salpingoeca rosetta]|eukprot:XP_004999057.1 hypothetical protein PTSG_00514 [Salpingoeca rosetta]